MRSKYRVLGAMATLSTFTINELARMSGVKGPTVRTVLNRNPQYYSSVGKASQGASLPRGGQTIQYTVSEEQQQVIMAELAELYPKLPGAPFDENELDPAAVASQKERAKAPGLQAVKELFTGAVHAWEPEERARLLSAAAATLPSVEAEVHAIRNSGVLSAEKLDQLESHWRFVRAAVMAPPIPIQIPVLPTHSIAPGRFVPVYITESTVGHKLGEFSPTGVLKGHSVRFATERAAIANVKPRVYIKQIGRKPPLNSLVRAFVDQRSVFLRGGPVIKVKRTANILQQPLALTK